MHVKTVGRVKVEQRQMVLVEVKMEEEVKDGKDTGGGAPVVFSALLQNAETVRLMSASAPGDLKQGDDVAVSVSVLKPGDRVLVHRQTGARHTGLKIAEERWYER